MKLTKYTGSLLAALAMLLTLGACQNSFDEPGLQTPEASLTPNMTIAELKALYWDDATNYIDTIRALEDGRSPVIAGRVISSDASGNIYKNLVIQDETAALTMSINANSLYNKYRIGQEIVISLEGMYIGKYNGLQQLGLPEWYAQGNAWEATFMPLEFFEQHAQLNGIPEPEKIDTLAISYSQISSTTPDVLRQYQSQLVMFRGASFEQGGEVPFTDGSKITSNRNLILPDGNTVIVRTSGYSNFWSTTLPKGTGNVVGILSYYGTSGWQLLLRSANDLIGFGEDVGENGSLSTPWTVTSAIELQEIGASMSGWVTGYIVGAAAPGIQAVTSNDDIEWGTDASMPNTLVIADDPAVRDFSQCIIVDLPNGTPLREYGNIADHPENVGKAITIYGNLGKVLGTWGLLGNSGAADQWMIDGVEVPGGGGSGDVVPPTPGGDPVEADGDVTFDFLNPSTLTPNSYVPTGSGVDGAAGVDGVTFTAGPVAMTNLSGTNKTPPRLYIESNGEVNLRLYAGNDTEFAVGEGGAIVKIEYTAPYSMPDCIEEMSSGTVTYGDKVVTWEGNASSVKLGWKKYLSGSTEYSPKVQSVKVWYVKSN